MQQGDDFLHKRRTTIKKYPAYRDSFVNGSWKWIEGKRRDDYAEELWRVHDKLYDLTDFITKHPGGKYWLEVTKGTDVTEAFESHHITSKPEEILKSFYVKDAADSRNYFFTYDEKGFYKTLKRRVATKLKTVDKSVTWKPRVLHDVNLFLMFFAAVMMQRADENWQFVSWAMLSAFCMALSTNLAHNFVHQANNWRMYSINVSLFTWRDYRIFHVLSHHCYTNTYSDFEVSIFDPYFKWIPTQTKSWRYRILTLILTPVMYLSFFHNMWRYRLQGYIWAKEKIFHWDELLTLALPALMAVASKESLSLSDLYNHWSYIVIPAEFLFACIYFNRGHHGCEQTHQNDEIKSLDFGEFQLSTTVDRTEANANTFTSLALYGDQVLHHLFPSLDSSILPQLRETLKKTCREFDIDLNPETTMLRATIGQFKQLYRSTTIECHS